MVRVNLAASDPCPSCGGQAQETFDGGRDRIVVYCDRERTVLRGPALRAWYEEHAKHCKGCDGRDGPAVWRCNFGRISPRWLLDGVRGIVRQRAAFELREAAE